MELLCLYCEWTIYENQYELWLTCGRRHRCCCCHRLATSAHQSNFITHHLELYPSVCVCLYTLNIHLIHIHSNFRLLNRFQDLAGKLTFHNLIEGMNEQWLSVSERERECVCVYKTEKATARFGRGIFQIACVSYQTKRHRQKGQ